MEALSLVGKRKPESSLCCLATQVNPKGDCFSVTCRKPRQPGWVYLAGNVLSEGVSGGVKGLGSLAKTTAAVRGEGGEGFLGLL